MTHLIIMPDLGQTTDELKVLKWLKKPGDKVSRGENLFEVQTDKVDMEVEAFESGYLREVLVGEGETTTAMIPIAILTDDPEESYEIPTDGERTIEPALEPGLPSARPPGIIPKRAGATPSAKSLAKELGVDLNLIVGTGPGGLITRRDVQRLASKRTEADSQPAPPMAAITSISKEKIPHFYVTVDVDVGEAERWRQNWNTTHPDLPVSLNDVFVRVASKGLRDTPRLNVHYRNGKQEPRPTADILLVVAKEHRLTLVPISEPCTLPWDEYLLHMRNSLLDPQRVRAGAQSGVGGPLLAISNLGMFGVKQFAAIIPPTCTAVLAIGCVRSEPIVNSDQQVVVGTICSLTLSADHRVVDGIIAAKFLSRVQEHLHGL